MKNEPTSTNKNHKILKAVPMILAFSVLGIGIFTLAEGGIEAKGYRGGNCYELKNVHYEKIVSYA